MSRKTVLTWIPGAQTPVVIRALGFQVLPDHQSDLEPSISLLTHCCLGYACCLGSLLVAEWVLQHQRGLGTKVIWLSPRSDNSSHSELLWGPLTIHACPLFPAALLNKDKDSS